MDCQKVVELLPAYQENDGPQRIQADISTHLAACANCQKEADLLSKSWELLDRVSQIEPSPGFRNEFWRRAQPDAEKTPFLRPIFAPFLTAAFAGLFGVFIGASLFQTKISRDLRTEALSPTDLSVAVFTSPAPLNSMEEWFVRRTSNE